MPMSVSTMLELIMSIFLSMSAALALWQSMKLLTFAQACLCALLSISIPNFCRHIGSSSKRHACGNVFFHVAFSLQP